MSIINKTNSIVKIDFDPTKGLLLKWNFRGHINSCFFRHIVVLDVGKKFDFEMFAKKYVDKVKLGDMILFCCVNSQGESCFQRWREKTPTAEFKLQRLKPSISDTDSLENLFAMIEQKNSQFQEPTILTVFSQRRLKQFDYLHLLTKKLIAKNKSYSANIFGLAQTSLQTVSGVNLFNLEDFRTEDSWVFLKHYWSQIALLNVRITIETENGSISAKNIKEWQTVDFNKISRELRMPSTIYNCDVIEFLNFDAADEVSYQLNITLEYRELNGKEYMANKSVLIKAMNEKMYQRTMAFRDVELSVELTEGLYSKQNPFKSNSLVWFNSNVAGSKEVIV